MRRRPPWPLWLRTGISTWSVVLITLGAFAAGVLPMQRRLLLDGLATAAQATAASVAQVVVSATAAKDPHAVDAHCMAVIGDGAVRYVALTRPDGSSQVYSAAGRSQYLAAGEGWPPQVAHGELRTSGILDDEPVYHYVHPLQGGAGEWSRIQVGLTRRAFDDGLRQVYQRLALLGGLGLAGASLLSLWLTRTLQRTQAELEDLVTTRAAELEGARAELQAEVAARQRAEAAGREAEAQLASQRTVDLRSDRLRSLGEMAAGIAHELNQPLTAVRGLAEHTLIGRQQGWEVDEEEHASRLQRILDQCDRMVHIIQHVRIFAREAGEAKVSPVNVNDVVDNAVDLLGAQFRSHGVDLQVEHGTDLPCVSANPFSLEEVVLNLLNNARDAVEEVGREDPAQRLVRVRTRCVDGVDAPLVMVDVYDTGVGIAAQDLARVFDPFFSTKEPNKGTGLGLSVSRSIVTGFGGTLSLISEAGRGTTASIQLSGLAS